MLAKLAHGCIRKYFSTSQIYREALQKYYRKNEYLNGFCNPQQSKQYAARNPKVHPQNWRNPKGISEQLTISSVGVGTFNGEATEEVDYDMFESLIESIKTGGVNVIDTCPLYRYGKSEKVINAALNYLIAEKGYSRGQFLVSTKCGYIPIDIDSNLQEKQFIQILTSQKIINEDDIAGGIHCVHPNFIDFSLQKSRLTLGLDTIDILYLNNFSEAHLPIVGEEKFYERLRRAFQRLEERRLDNKIRYYGICSYVGLRSPKTEEQVHLKLQRTIQIAKSIGGKNHGFRFLMVPLSLGTPETLLKWQEYENNGKIQDLRVFDIAQREGINVVACSPLFQGRVANLDFQSDKMNYLKYNSAKHLQMIRSYFSPSLLTTLVGQTTPEHVHQNLSLLESALITQQDWKEILPIPE